MPIPNDYREIVEMLLDKSEAGKVHWQQDKYAVSVNVDSSKFSLWAGNDEETGEPFVALSLSDQDGSNLDNWYVDRGEGADYTTMHRMWLAAKRQATGVGDRLKGLQKKIATSAEIGK